MMFRCEKVILDDGSIGWKIIPEEGVDLKKFNKAVEHLHSWTAGEVTIAARKDYAIAYNEFGDMDKELLRRAINMIKSRMKELEDEVLFFEV